MTRLASRKLPFSSVRIRRPGKGDQSLRLVNLPHLLFIHSATVHFYFRQHSFDLPKICKRQLNIDCCQVLGEMIHVACNAPIALTMRAASRPTPWIIDDDIA